MLYYKYWKIYTKGPLWIIHSIFLAKTNSNNLRENWRLESIPYRKRFFSYSLTVTNPMQPAGIPSKIISNHNYQQEQMLLVEYIWTKCMKGGIRFNRGVRYSVQSTAGHTNEISFAFYMSILFSIVGRIYYSILSIASSISLTPSHIFYLSWKSFKSTSVYEFKLNY